MKTKLRPILAGLLAGSFVLGSVNMGVNAEVTANPVISRDCPAYSSADDYSMTYANDAHYYSFWNGTAPTYLAYDLSGVPEENRKEVLAVWYNATGHYDPSVLSYSSTNGAPSDYTIEVNAADGGTYPEDGWVVMDTVEANTCHSRQHIVKMEGYNWIRINITGVDCKESGSASINFDIHDVSDGASDSWIFFGDSITAGGMMNCYGTGFATYINQLDDRYFPVQENGGIGGIRSVDGAANIDRWLSYFPGKYVSIAYGTNDAWGNQTGADAFYENTAYMVEQVIAAGKTPIVPKIPYATIADINTYLDEYNAKIDLIYENYPDVIPGPDFDTFFRENPDGLSSDGVHPNDTGYDGMRQLWAQTMYERVYQAEEITTEPIVDSMGDINADGTLSVNDLIALQRYLLALASFSQTQFNCADLNQDDSVNAYDLAALKKVLLNL